MQDAFALDSKIDDAKADTGRLLTYNQDWGTGNCVTGDPYTTDGSANYSFTNSPTDCAMAYFMKQ